MIAGISPHPEIDGNLPTPLAKRTLDIDTSAGLNGKAWWRGSTPWGVDSPPTMAPHKEESFGEGKY